MTLDKVSVLSNTRNMQTRKSKVVKGKEMSYGNKKVKNYLKTIDQRP